MNKIIYTLLAATLLTACVKDTIYNTSHPTQGVVEITTSWEAVPDGTTPPSTYTIMLNGTIYALTADGKPFVSEPLDSKSSCDILVYNIPAGMSVKGDIATVNTITNDVIIGSPEALYSAMAICEIIADSKTKVAVKMTARTKYVELNLSFTKEEAARIKQINTELSGLVQTVNLCTGTLIDDNLKVQHLFTDFNSTRAGTRADTDSNIKLSYNLVGVSTVSQQILTVTITMHDGSTQTVIDNITDKLENLNQTDKPIELEAELIVPDATDPTTTITIKDWTVVTGDSDAL